MDRFDGDFYLGVAVCGTTIGALISAAAGLIGLVLGEWTGFGLCMCASVIGFGLLLNGLGRK